jgi:hypothetical protein
MFYCTVKKTFKRREPKPSILVHDLAWAADFGGYCVTWRGDICDLAWADFGGADFGGY